MNYKLRISEQAQKDIESIYNYVLKDGVTIAKKQANLIYSTLEKLELFPEMGANLSTYTIEKTIINFFLSRKHILHFTKYWATRFVLSAFSEESKITFVSLISSSFTNEKTTN